MVPRMEHLFVSAILLIILIIILSKLSEKIKKKIENRLIFIKLERAKRLTTKSFKH